MCDFFGYKHYDGVTSSSTMHYTGLPDSFQCCWSAS